MTESPDCDGCPPGSYDFTYHVGNSFTDVPPSQFFYSYIETLLHDNVTSGCTATTYCPSLVVQRQAMAKFLCNAMNVTDPGSCTTTSCTDMFTDVPTSNPFCPFIEALANAGVVSGCAPSLFCPTDNVLRDQMAKFLVNAFDLSL